MVGTKKPALDQCGNAVNARQRFMCRDFGSKDDMGIVLKPIVLQGCINCRSVSADRAAWRDVFLYKRNDCFDGGCSNALKANTPKALGLMHLNGNGDRYQMAAVMGFGAWGAWGFSCPFGSVPRRLHQLRQCHLANRDQDGPSHGENGATWSMRSGSYSSRARVAVQGH